MIETIEIEDIRHCDIGSSISKKETSNGKAYTVVARDMLHETRWGYFYELVLQERSNPVRYWRTHFEIPAGDGDFDAYEIPTKFTQVTMGTPKAWNWDNV